MPSAAGKRVERVLAGCSKPEAIDKPGLSLCLVRILGFRPSEPESVIFNRI